MVGIAVNIAIVGTCFIAETRARAYACVTGYDARLVAAVSRSPEQAEAYAARHAIPDAYSDYARVLDRATVARLQPLKFNHEPGPNRPPEGGAS